ncbi:CHAT domain-containing protein [Fulvivirga sp. RKSG066]|uniref:CHAT domain-containing protein n=1 Tax=Fulvivirga aurantia TaxID=2529383 RepID=UPI0012BC61B2|nr:CHAT domain-containing protein [Fulvivirga aurantia]MTI21701.1 CHAT domain-containing protein [Fulvivirga aurantia]
MKITLSIVIFWFCAFAPAIAQDWKSHYDSASYYWNSDLSKAIKHLRQSEKIALSELGLYDPNYLIILSDLGLAQLRNRDFQKAEKNMKQALNLKEQVLPANHPEIGKSLLNLGNLYNTLQNDSLALSHYQQVKLHPKGQAVYFEALEATSFLLGKDSWKLAHENFKKAIAQLLENNPTDNLRIWLQLIEARILLGSPDFESVEQILSSLTELISYASVSQSLVFQYHYLNGLKNQQSLAYAKAEISFLEASKYQTGKTNDQINLYGQLAAVYHKTGNFEESKNYYNKALGLCTDKAANYDKSCRLIKNNLANLYLNSDLLSESQELYDEVINEYKTLPKDSIYYTAKFGQGLIMMKQDDYALAEQLFTEARAELNQKDNQSLLATAKNNLGLIALSHNDFEGSRSLFEEALTHKSKSHGRQSIEAKDIINHLALSSWLAGDRIQAIEYLEESLALIEKEIGFVFPSLTLLEQTQYYEKLKLDFEKFYSIILTEKEVNPELLKSIYQHQINVKGLLFNYERKRSELVQSVNDQELNNKYQQLLDMRKKISFNYSNSKVDASVKDLEKDIRNLEKEVAAAIDEESAIESQTWEDIQASLGEDEAFVNLIRFRKFSNSTAPLIKSDERLRVGFTDSIYYAALITTKQTIEAPKLVLLKRGKYLEQRANTYLKNATRFNVVEDHSYRFYWEAVDKELKGKSKIFVSNDGVYHKINLATLYDPNYGDYLIKKYNIIYVINPGSKPNKQKFTNRSTNSVALFGNPYFGGDGEKTDFNPLPGTEDEIRILSKKLSGYGWQSKLYSGKAASKQELKSVGQPSILHLATHGFYMDTAQQSAVYQYPLLKAGLALANTNGQGRENILTAFEASNLSLLNTDLVTLSACESGLGDIKHGEGIYGLQRAFLTAGSKQVMSSLWKVDDQLTTSFMDYFYSGLIDGNSSEDALRKAQLAMKAITNDPKDWGGFVLINP